MKAVWRVCCAGGSPRTNASTVNYYKQTSWQAEENQQEFYSARLILFVEKPPKVCIIKLNESFTYVIGIRMDVPGRQMEQTIVDFREEDVLSRWIVGCDADIGGRFS